MKRGNWTDLSVLPSLHLDVETDICVIGAGAAGIYLATQLAQQRGCSVVLVEGGPAYGADVSEVGFEPIFARDPYSGATIGRYFGMGGSTTRWGGVLVPHTDFDVRGTDKSAEAWKRIVRVVVERSPTVLKVLGYKGGDDFETFAERSLGQVASTLAGCGFQVQSGLCLPFLKKNLVGLLSPRINRPARLKVFFNAVAKSWMIQSSVNKDASIRQLIAISRNQHELRIKADKFVICTGTIEAARMLLEIQDGASRPVLRESARPGWYLSDHLSLSIADVLPNDLEKTASLFAPRFSGAWMRGFRLLETDVSLNSQRAFAHFIFDNHSRGFELAKALLSAIQQRRIPQVGLRGITGGVIDLARLGYGRFVESRLYIPPATEAHLQLDMEQIPVWENRVTLSNQRDAYGRRIAEIHWHVSQEDMEALKKTAENVLKKWPGFKAGLPELKPRTIIRTGGEEQNKPYDAYHPVGTCRMGNDAQAVVDHNLKVWGVDNLWVASTGVLPTAGSANPTFTLLCLSHELAEHLRYMA